MKGRPHFFRSASRSGPDADSLGRMESEVGQSHQAPLPGFGMPELDLGGRRKVSSRTGECVSHPWEHNKLGIDLRPVGGSTAPCLR